MNNNNFENKQQEEEIMQTENIEQQQEENQEEEMQQEEQENVEMEINEENKEQELLDNKILAELDKIREDFKSIDERIIIIKKILSEDFDQFETMNNIIEKKQTSKNVKKSFMENEIKLEKLLLRLDALTGASEKVRPEKKNLVSTIQKSITEIEEILKNQIKQIETKIQEEENIIKKKEEEERKVKEEEEKQKREIEKKEMKSKEEEKMVDSDNEIEIEREKEKISESPKQSQKKEKVEQKEGEQKQEEEENSFPLPKKEDWKKLSFDPEFDVQQKDDKFVVYSRIENLNIKDISLKISHDKLTIEGVKYPTKEEEILLVKKLMMSLRNPYQIKNYSKTQIINAILKIGSQYNFGSFSATYRLPPNLDSSEDISASYQNGILKVDLPIKRKAQNPFGQNYSRRPEVPFYNQRNRNPFYGFF